MHPANCFGFSTLSFLVSHVAANKASAQHQWSLRRQQPSMPVALAVGSDDDMYDPHEGHPHGSAITDQWWAGDHGFKEEDHHHQHSIFEMKLADLDCKDFWLIVFFMLVFTVIVDRVQWYITMKAQSNRCNKMFVERVVSELMMFGVVAISVFVFSQLASMTEHTHHLFEFTDVLCSFGACFLILMGIVLFCFRQWFEWSQDKTHYDPKEVLSKLKSVTSLKELPSGTVRSLQNSVKRAQFFARHKLTNQTFSWNLFLIETLNEGICELINLNWITWVAACILAGIILLWRHQIGHMGAMFHEIEHPHLVGYLVCTWINWALCVSQYISLLASHKQLRFHLGLTTVETMRVGVEEAQRIEAAIDANQSINLDGKDSDLDTVIKRLARMSTIFAQISQMLALGLCFMSGFYVMHLIHNINHFKDHSEWAWHLAFLVPLGTGLFLLLPLILVELASIQAFCDPSHDVMDSVIEQVHQASTDLQFLRTQLESASPEGTDAKKFVTDLLKNADVKTDDVISIKEFQKVLSKVGVKVSKERTARLCLWISKDTSITYGELLEKIFK